MHGLFLIHDHSNSEARSIISGHQRKEWNANPDADSGFAVTMRVQLCIRTLKSPVPLHSA
jgi:hypothetical protein